MIKKLLLLILGISIPLMGITESSKEDNEIVINSGKPGGAYDQYATKLELLLKPLYTVIKQPSSGGYENLTRLAATQGVGGAVGFAQADTVAYFFNENAGNLNKIQLIRPLGKECVFLVTKEGGKVNSDADLQKAGTRVAIGDINSGSYYTYHTMIKMEPGYAKSSKVQVGGPQALSLLSTNTIDAFIFVTNPNLLFDTEMYKNIIKLGLTFKPIGDWDLNDVLPNTTLPIYTFDKVKVRESFFGSTIDTICVDSYLVGKNGMDETTLNRLFNFDTK